MSDSPIKSRKGLVFFVVLQLFCAAAILSLPSLHFGKALWLLPEYVLIGTFGAGYAACIAILAWRSRSRPISIAELASALAMGYSIPFLFITLTGQRFPRQIVVAEITLGAVLAAGAFLIRAAPAVRAGAAVLVGVAGIGIQVFYRQAALPPPVKPVTTVAHIFTQVYNVKATNYKNRVKKLDVSGGGLALFGDGYLLALGDGFMYTVTKNRENGLLSFDRYRHRVPINPADLVASVGNKVSLVYFRVADIHTQEVEGKLRVFASHHFWKTDERCFVLRVSMLEAPKDDVLRGRPGLPWKTIFDTSPCLPVEFPGRGLHFQGLETGGRIVQLNESELLLSVGDLGFDGLRSTKPLAQDPESTYGKMMLINLKDLSSQVYSLGHRNPQGLAVDANGLIWSSEHGPQGGDEVNLIQRGANYGWPISTYGVEYGANTWPLNPVQGSHDLPGHVQPYLSFVPSFAVLSIMISDSPLFKLWKGDILMGTLRGGALIRLRIRDNRVVLMEHIPLRGERIRDILQGHDGEVLLWEDTGSIIVLKPSEESEQNGRALFDRCVACHGRWDGKKHRIGPDLFNVVNMPVAAKEDYAYSPALKAYGGAWTRERLDAYLADPQAAVPGTTMQYPGVKDASARARLIEFLESGSARTPEQTIDEAPN